ncbi:MAG: PTS sugar transporter subunit IIA [Succinivibrio sp.]
MIVLPETQILSPLFCFSKKRLFEEIAQCAGYLLNTPQNLIIEKLNERECLGTTVFYPGIAIPHAVVKGNRNTETFGVLCILDKPISYNSIDADEQLIDIAYSVFISPDEDLEKMEDLLKKITQIMSNNDLLNAMRLSKNEKAKVMTILHQIDGMLDSEPQMIQTQVTEIER